MKEDVKRFHQGTHNIAEWQALILGLRIALEHGEGHVVVKGDSMLDGMELDEDAVRAQQMLEQVSTLVEENPDAAATLVKRWLNRS